MPQVLDRPERLPGLPAAEPAPCEAPPAPRCDPDVAARPRARLPFIDGLRGLAMLMVLACHCWIHTGGIQVLVPIGRGRIDLAAPFHYGYLGVHLFLLLSGFCLTYPLVRHGMPGMRLELGRFARRRACRILPPYYVALAGFLALRVLDSRVHAAQAGVGALHERLTAGNFIAHVLMFHNLVPAWKFSIDPAFWSLALEWQLYLVFPLLVWGFRRWGVGRTVLAVLALTLTYRTWAYVTYALWLHDSAHDAAGDFVCYALPGRIFEFVLGMLAAVQMARMPEAPARVWMHRYLAGALALGLAALAVAHGWSPYSPITDVLWGLAFFCLLMCGAGWSAVGGGWLQWRPLVSLGLISYSVYLIHEPLIRRVYPLVQGRHVSPVATLLFSELVLGPLLIGLGWLFFRLVEARFLRTGTTRPA